MLFLLLFVMSYQTPDTTAKGKWYANTPPYHATTQKICQMSVADCQNLTKRQDFTCHTSFSCQSHKTLSPHLSSLSSALTTSPQPASLSRPRLLSLIMENMSENKRNASEWIAFTIQTRIKMKSDYSQIRQNTFPGAVKSLCASALEEKEEKR